MNYNDLVLNRNEVEYLHEQTLELLEKKGIHFEHEGALETFRANGCRTDGNVVFFTREQVDQAIGLSPRTFDWESRESSVKVDGKAKGLYGSAAGPAFFMDADGTVRRGTLADYRKLAKMVDTSDVMDFGHSLLVDIGDVPTERSPYIQVANLLKYMDKPINLTAMQTPEESVKTVARKQIQMIKRFYGKEGGNVALGGACATAPMHYGTNDVDAVLGFLEEKQPISLIACSLPVITSHASVVSTIVQNNAEVLAGLVLVQLVQPGTPFVYATISSSVNLRTVSALFGSAEVALMSAATASLADYYDVPYRSGGSLTDAVAVDFQAGVESTYNLAPIILSNVDVMQFSCGSLGSLNITSLEKYVLDEEALKMALRMKKGLGVDRDKSYIEGILPIKHKGHFMTGPTPKEYFDEHFVSDLFTKTDYNNWQQRDGKALLTKAEERVQARLDAYEEREFDSQQMEIIQEYLD
ncbi:MAG: trimethylamine methyltransferase family protein [Desulfobacterales bacterium]|nr:trimethylamine methyltransferase family protein [Desulfobacterales bacterium]